jgi:hypothetical protein
MTKNLVKKLILIDNNGIGKSILFVNVIDKMYSVKRIV